MRMRVVWIAAVLTAAGVGSAVLVTPGCQAGRDMNRTGRVLLMAAEESAYITSLQDRLERQLNIADLLIQADRKQQAVETLELARTTLRQQEKDNKTIDDFRRIAGWTSIAELARQAGDRGMAIAAADDAVEALNSVEPEARRAEYVLSLAEEIRELRGEVEAGRLLEKGGKWAAKIEDTPVRRFALQTFARRLVTLNQFEEARRTLRNELDAAWRADTLVAMAEPPPPVAMNAMGMAKSPQAADVPTDAKSLDSATAARVAGFNKDVRYEQNYRRADLQRQWQQQLR